MLPPGVDEYAREIAVTRYGLHPCLHVPIAAVDEAAIERYIGRIAADLAPGTPGRAFVVDRYEVPPMNPRLPIWDLPQSSVLHEPRQVWVDVNYSAYRSAYVKAFPDQGVQDRVIDHVFNRRIARLVGCRYVRLVPISRAANSSSGVMSEVYGVDHQRSRLLRPTGGERPLAIRYADLADIVKMLDMKTGGALQEGVNDAQRLVEER